MDGVDCVVVAFFFFQAEDGIRDLVRSRGLGDVYKRQTKYLFVLAKMLLLIGFFSFEIAAQPKTFLKTYNSGNCGFSVREVNSNSYAVAGGTGLYYNCLLYTSPSPRDRTRSRMPSSA